jgi:hypothetical protein
VPSGAVVRRRRDVFDTRNDDRFELEVDARHALDAFNHPSAYPARTDRVSALTDALAA